MTKKFIKDNRGQVLYAVIVTVMFMGVLSMIAMGMTLKNYQSAVKKQENLRNYYAADAVVERIRVGEIVIEQAGDEEYMDEYDATVQRLTLDELPTVSEDEATSTSDSEQKTIKTTISEYNEAYQVTTNNSVTLTVTMHVVATKTETQVTPIRDGTPDPSSTSSEVIEEVTRTIISWEVSYNAG